MIEPFKLSFTTFIWFKSNLNQNDDVDDVEGFDAVFQFHNMIHQNLYIYNNFILAGWTLFICKINIFEIIKLQLLSN